MSAGALSGDGALVHALADGSVVGIVPAALWLESDDPPYAPRGGPSRGVGKARDTCVACRPGAPLQALIPLYPLVRLLRSELAAGLLRDTACSVTFSATSHLPAFMRRYSYMGPVWSFLTFHTVSPPRSCMWGEMEVCSAAPPPFAVPSPDPPVVSAAGELLATEVRRA